MDVVLSAFESQPPKVSQNGEPFISYPKYLPKYKLLPLQMQDPKFCVSFMLQLIFLLESFKKPVSAMQKRSFNVGDGQKRTIDQTIKRIYKILSGIKGEAGNLEDTVKQIIQREDSVWTTWKEAKGCAPFEKQPSEEVRSRFGRAKEKLSRKMLNKFPQKLDITFRKVSKSKTDKLSLSRSTLISDFSEVLAIPVSANIPETSLNPLMGDLLERVFLDLDPEQGIEKEYRAKNDPVCDLIRIGIRLEVAEEGGIYGLEDIYGTI